MGKHLWRRNLINFHFTRARYTAAAARNTKKLFPRKNQKLCQPLCVCARLCVWPISGSNRSFPVGICGQVVSLERRFCSNCSNSEIGGQRVLLSPRCFSWPAGRIWRNSSRTAEEREKHKIKEPKQPFSKSKTGEGARNSAMGEVNVSTENHILATPTRGRGGGRSSFWKDPPQKLRFIYNVGLFYW